MLHDGCHGAPLANNSIKCNPFLALEVSLSNEGSIVGSLSFPLFGDSNLDTIKLDMD